MCKWQQEQQQQQQQVTAPGEDLLSNHLQLLLGDLAPKEVELAARSDYHYYHGFVSEKTSDDGKDGEQQQQRQREAAAAAMAQRYLQSKSSYKRALKGLRATLEFRSKLDLDGTFRSITTMNDKLQQNLANGNAYVTGRDLLGRATLVFTPRLVEQHEASVDALMWTMERAIACSWYCGEINAIVDYGGFELWKHSPPLAVGKALLTLLRSYYVGHVNCILFVNAPKSVNYLWNMFKPFTGQSTQDKISFVKCTNDLAKLYAKDQLPPSILETGSHPEFHAEAYFSAKYDCLQSE